VPFTIMKSWTFEAAHRLATWPATHQCHRLHGHTYEVRIYLRHTRVGPLGAVLDFGELAPFRDEIMEQFDHQFINDRVSFEPTSENLAHFLYWRARDRWPSLIHAVRVYETPDSYAEYKRDD
jgi:6-pyruvoyltetrahydropterin/6-carboxytetrahydropterin synthase